MLHIVILEWLLYIALSYILHCRGIAISRRSLSAGLSDPDPGAKCSATSRKASKHMTKLYRTATEASGGVIHHGVRYVLGASLTLVVIAFIVAFAYR